MYNISRNEEVTFSGYIWPTVTDIGLLLGSFGLARRLLDASLIDHEETVHSKTIVYLISALIFCITRKFILKAHSLLKAPKPNHSMKREKSDLLQIARESSAASLTKLRQVSSIAMRQLPCFKSDKACFVPVLSSTDPFVSLSHLENTTLTELSNIINYTILCTSPDFDKHSFLSREAHHVQEIIIATNAAVVKARGFNINGAKTAGTTSNGNYDALYFCAASRLIVEWRAVKVVPEEYKAYAVGMNLAKRDLIQNVAKVENGIHKWIENEVIAGKEEISSPTISELLKYELANGTHSRLPKLRDNSIAIGVVWMYRQLQFQFEIFRNLQQFKASHDSAIEVMKCAYKTVFDKYHGWALQQGFNYAFKGAPPVSMIFSMMNPDLSASIETEANEADLVILQMPSQSTDNDEADKVIPLISQKKFQVFDFFQNIENGWKEFSCKLEQEWFGLIDKVVTGGKYPMKEDRTLTRSQSDSDTDSDVSTTSDDSVCVGSNCAEETQSSIPSFILSGASLELHIKRETAKAANNDMKAYSTVMKPMLEDILSTIRDFGMNDPSRV